MHRHPAQFFHLVGVAEGVESLPRSQDPETQTYVQKPSSTIAAVIGRPGFTAAAFLFRHPGFLFKYPLQISTGSKSLPSARKPPTIPGRPSVLVLMHFPFMTGMVMIVRAVLAAVFVVMRVSISGMAVIMNVFVEMLMGVRVRMFVSVLLISMSVLMRMPVSMFMTMQMTMFVFSFHAGLLSLMGQAPFGRVPFNLRPRAISSISCFSFPGYFIVVHNTKK